MTYDEVISLLDGITVMRESVDDKTALKCKGVYPFFKSLCKKEFVAKEPGFKFQYQGGLYKTLQPSTAFVEHYAPGAGTESMFEKIDESHAGTVEDPIPYDGNMRLELGKHYSQEGVIYKCIRDSGNPIYHALKDLVGNYVEVVQ